PISEQIRIVHQMKQSFPRNPASRAPATALILAPPFLPARVVRSGGSPDAASKGDSMKLLNSALSVVGAASLALLAGCDSAADNSGAMPPPPEVSVAEVLVRDVQHWDEFTGRIEAVESVELRPRVSGYIE